MLDSQAASQSTPHSPHPGSPARQDAPDSDELCQRLQDYLRLSGVALSPSVELEVIAISEAAISRTRVPSETVSPDLPRRNLAYREGLNRLIHRFGLDAPPSTTPPPAIQRCGMGYGRRT